MLDVTFLSDGVKNDEIEDWAAKKIQNSFKLYKHQKTLSRDLSVEGDPSAPAGAIAPPPQDGKQKWALKHDKSLRTLLSKNSRHQSCEYVIIELFYNHPRSWQ